jgi:hypothetical protein
MPTEYKVVDGADGRLVEVFDTEEEAYPLAATSRFYRVEERTYHTTDENSAEDNDEDDDTTNMNYNFIAADDDAQDDTNDFDTVGSMWTLGEHSALQTENRQNLVDSIDGVMGDIDSEIDEDVMGVLQDARSVVGNTRVTRFECPVEECGLGHSHSDHKHDIRSGFDVVDGFADQMDFCPYCHCGVNELAMLMDFYPYINADVFADGGRFEAVDNLSAGNLQRLWTLYNDGSDLNDAISMVADENGVSFSALVGDDTRQALQAFFSLRDQIQNAASSAPIAQETRRVIGENRDSIEAQIQE